MQLQHQLATRLTSLVAVDKTPSRPEGTALKLTDLPLNLPAGWDFAKVFGERPQLPKPPAERRADASNVQTAMVKRPQPAVMPDTVRLPKTATDAELKIIAGSILLMLSLLLSLTNRRRRLARGCPGKGGAPHLHLQSARGLPSPGRAREFSLNSVIARGSAMIETK